MPKFLLVAGLAMGACVAALAFLLVHPAPARSVVLITLDTTRPDHMSLYGYGKDTTPQLQALAREAVVFDHAYTLATESGPSHASMLTGLSPWEHGVVTNSAGMAKGVEPVAARLQKLGYDTAAFISFGLVGAVSGLNQGFDAFELVADRGHFVDAPPLEEALRIFEKAAAYIREHKTGYFLWVHAQHPHGDYRPPVQFEEMFNPDAMDTAGEQDCFPDMHDAILAGKEIPQVAQQRVLARYDGEIAVVDTGVGMLLRALSDSGALPNTAVVVASDHGETLFDRAAQREFGHMAYFHKEVLHAALLARIPGLAPGRWPGWVSTGLVAGTLAQWAGAVEPVGKLRTLQALVASGKVEKELPLTTWPGVDGVEAAGQGKWRLMGKKGEEALFDVAADPAEKTNVAAQHPDVVRTLRAALEQDRKKYHLIKEEKHMNAGVEEMLKRGGYLRAGMDGGGHGHH